jgi:membrane protein YqaA with SNARE-associated domain
MKSMKRSTTKLYNWALEKAASTKAPLWLFLLFFLEIILFIPLDAVLVFFCLQKRNRILFYILIATVASTLSGFMGYLLGHFLWDLIGNWVVPHLISASAFATLSGHMVQYENWAIFFGAILPFPLKALSVVGGVFKLGMIPFLTCLALARLVRFSLVGGVIAIWGEKFKLFIDRHFHRIFMLIGAKVAVAFLFFWALAR